MGAASATRDIRRLHRLQYAQASVTLWKRRARVAATCLAAAALVPALALTFPLLDRDGAIASAITTVVADAGSILSARSPGARQPGALTQTKKKKKVASGGRKRDPKGRVPTERVLSGERERPGGFADAPLPFGPSAFDGLPDTPVVVADNLTPLPDIPGVPVIGLEPVGNPGGGGGPVGGGGGGENPPPGTVPSVPEPATWATFILGFFLIGTAIRRRRGGIAAGAR